MFIKPSIVNAFLIGCILLECNNAIAIEPARNLCERTVQPLGITNEHPRLSWISTNANLSDRGQTQTAYQILVASNPAALSDDKGDLWDSKKIVSDQSLDIAYAGKPLQSGQACFWKVRVWDRDGVVSAWAPAASWSMGVLNGKQWQGQWIGAHIESGIGAVGQPTVLRTPRLRREFTLDKPIARAWIYASALGIYELRLNGDKVGDQYFAPGWTNYRKRIEYQTYDVTRMLHVGGNALAAQLAPGWYAGNIGWFGPDQYGSEPRFFAELHIEFKDGSRQVTLTDPAWKTSAGPLVSSDFQDGERYDARLEQPGWDKAGYDDHGWVAVDTEANGDQQTARLVSQIDPPMRVIREWKPVEVTQPIPGVYIYRLPQNITGVVRLTLKGKAGAVVTICHGEAVNPDGTLNLITLNSPGIANARAHNIDTYILGESGQATFQPHFTWCGFKYVQVSGTSEQPALRDVTGVSIGTDVSDIGQLSTSNELVNRINENLHWSGRDAFMSFPMDCPQRSERLGWAGDANFYMATAAFNFDLSRFYTKWENDLIDSQGTDGRLCHVAPGGWAGASSEGGYGGGWGDVAICVPYRLWKTYGDVGPIGDHYQAMEHWVEFLQHLSPDLVLPANMAAAGDWQNQSDPTPHELCATAYFAYDVKLLSEMADAIGKPEDGRKYRKLFGEIREAFIKKFVSSNAKVATGSQTAYVLALHIGLIPESLRDIAAAHLIANVNHHGNKLTTGFVGTQWLLPVLTEIGRTDLAYAILEQTNKPSWGYMVNHGATTIWENWNVVNANGTINSGPNSLNHCALGSCGDWIYENIGGLRCDPGSAAFKDIIIEPRPGGGLTHAEARYDSPYGLIVTRWQLDAGHLFLDTTIPVGTRAKIILPGTSAAAVSEGGMPVEDSKSVRCLKGADGALTYEVGSGNYSFQTKTP
jgi:alpha-L-rhamnosidase